MPFSTATGTTLKRMCEYVGMARRAGVRSRRGRSAATIETNPAALPGRHGPTKALFVTLAFAIPATADFLIHQAIGARVPQVIGEIAAFGSVTTCTGLMMDLQTFQNERRYWPTNASLVAYVYQMRFATIAFFLAQLVALATLWKAFADVTTSAPRR
ncbi:DUF6185 family protein [Streptomyces sp. NPDC006692]|uniref:DUF6185 family protein n=1 Tax=unclassified Streptomyces TaxID=2593676 RepID=UPI0036B14FB8